jgi:hypothetical protein
VGIDGAVFASSPPRRWYVHPVEPGVANKWKRRGERLGRARAPPPELLADLLERGWYARRRSAALLEVDEHLAAAGVDRDRFEAVVVTPTARRALARLEVGGR